MFCITSYQFTCLLKFKLLQYLFSCSLPPPPRLSSHHLGAFTHTRGEANVASPRFSDGGRGEARRRSPRLAYVCMSDATTIQSYKNSAVLCRHKYSLEFTVQ